MPSTQLKTAALAPIPRVRQRIAKLEKPGLRRRLDASEVEERFATRLLGAHAPSEVAFDGNFQVRPQFRVQVVFEMTAAEECGETVAERAAKFAHRLARPQHPVNHGGHAIPAFGFFHELFASGAGQ